VPEGVLKAIVIPSTIPERCKKDFVKFKACLAYMSPGYSHIGKA
jgi:hypothetical protein